MVETDFSIVDMCQEIGKDMRNFEKTFFAQFKCDVHEAANIEVNKVNESVLVNWIVQWPVLRNIHFDEKCNIFCRKKKLKS